MRYLSVCSGIEAATVAWHSQGFDPLAFSEIEKFPRQVLAHHYPDVPLHGDFTVLREQDWIADVDILVGGTPCQAFSVAGLRNSLDDDRGNLTLEFVRLADAIDDLRPTGCGTIIVWENVPGVLSVNDNAFGCFLGALVGNDDPIVPTGGKWTSAGMVVGSKRSAAWRVLDAQYFGVAQRRRRVFVVASSRDGFDPAEVLFEREGVRRNTPPSREQGQEVAATVAQCFDRQRSDEYGEENIASTMSARDYKSASDLVAHPVYLGNAEGGALERPFLTCHNTGGTARISNQTPLIGQLYSIMPQNSGKDYKAREVDVSQPIMASGSSGGNQGGDYVMQSMAVRRLTPVECERLQGFPDNYTNIPMAADGPRYKALGNSMAVPVMAWIGKRIAREVAA
jgi:DNA (cytosine-5)-methyltransferase 1